MACRQSLALVLASLIVTGLVTGCSSFTEFEPRQRPQPDESAQRALDELPKSAVFDGESSLGGNVIYTYAGYVNFDGECSEETRIERLPVPGTDRDAGEVIEVVRSQGTTYVRAVTGEFASETWYDSRSGEGPAIALFTPSFYAYANPFGPGVCGLTEAAQWVATKGNAQDIWSIDVARTQAYLAAVSDDYLAWLLTDPTLDVAGKAGAARIANEMRNNGVYDADFGSVLSNSNLQINPDSVVYRAGGGDAVDTWRFTPSLNREVQTPAGAEPATPVFTE